MNNLSYETAVKGLKHDWGLVRQMSFAGKVYWCLGIVLCVGAVLFFLKETL